MAHAAAPVPALPGDVYRLVASHLGSFADLGAWRRTHKRAREALSSDYARRGSALVDDFEWVRRKIERGDVGSTRAAPHSDPAPLPSTPGTLDIAGGAEEARVARSADDRLLRYLLDRPHLVAVTTWAHLLRRCIVRDGPAVESGPGGAILQLLARTFLRRERWRALREDDDDDWFIVDSGYHERLGALCRRYDDSEKSQVRRPPRVVGASTLQSLAVATAEFGPAETFATLFTMFLWQRRVLDTDELLVTDLLLAALQRAVVSGNDARMEPEIARGMAHFGYSLQAAYSHVAMMLMFAARDFADVRALVQRCVARGADRTRLLADAELRGFDADAVRAATSVDEASSQHGE